MPDHLQVVIQYVTTMEGWLERARDKNDLLTVKNYERRLEALGSTIEEVKHLRRVTMPLPASYGDISDLPEELLKELSGVKVDDLEQQLYAIVKSGGQADLDSILIELYRRHGVVQTRRFVQNKLYRMSQKAIVFPVPGRKGVYTSKQIALDSDREAVESNVPLLANGNSSGNSTYDDDDVPF